MYLFFVLLLLNLLTSCSGITRSYTDKAEAFEKGTPSYGYILPSEKTPDAYFRISYSSIWLSDEKFFKEAYKYGNKICTTKKNTKVKYLHLTFNEKPSAFGGEDASQPESSFFRHVSSDIMAWCDK